MGLIGRCMSVFIILTVVIIALFEGVLYSQMPLSANILFGAFAALLGAIFYGWIDEMFITRHQSGLEK